MKRLLLICAASAAGVLAWSRRGHLQSIGARKLAAAVSDPLRSRGLKIRIPVERGGWIRTTLTADLGPALSEVAGYQLEAAAHSHFGGFNLSGVYSDFINPDSDYYQAWVGAYVVFAVAGRRHFGFDDEGRPLQQDVLDVLEAARGRLRDRRRWPRESVEPRVGRRGPSIASRPRGQAPTPTCSRAPLTLAVVWAIGGGDDLTPQLLPSLPRRSSPC